MTTNTTKTAGFGVANLKITEETNAVTIQFDPETIIGAFKEKLLKDGSVRPGNPKVCSTGSYRTLDVSGVKIMLHVIGRS